MARKPVLFATLLSLAVFAPLARGQELQPTPQVFTQSVIAELCLPEDDAESILKALMSHAKKVHAGQHPTPHLTWVAQHPQPDLAPFMPPELRNGTQFLFGKCSHTSDALLRRLGERGMFDLLHCPKMMTADGQTGSCLVGQSFPVFRSTRDNDAWEMAEQFVGTQVKVTPTVLASGKIRLKLDVVHDDPPRPRATHIDTTTLHAEAEVARGQMLFALTPHAGKAAKGTVRYLLCVVRPEVVMPR